MAERSSTASEAESAAFHALVDGSAVDEAQRVVDLVRRIQVDDTMANGSRCWCVRERTYADRAGSRAANLRFTAGELELLLARHLIGDLLAWTRALEACADRVRGRRLRAPWCG